MNKVTYAICLAATVCLSGCVGPGVGSRGTAGSYLPGRKVKPVVAVQNFENRSGFRGKWSLGEGMADLLVAELMDSEKVTVLERQRLDGVLGELALQGKKWFRPEGRVEPGRLINARYLIRGAVTDFTVTGDASGWFGASGVSGRLRGSRARVSLTVQVSDVETGEILSSVRTEGTASAGGFSAGFDYKAVAFGGDAYFRTPLGSATEKALQRAVKQILRELPGQHWQPRVAEAGPDTIIINGGENVRVRIGDVFNVRDAGRDVTDPVTGNVLERIPGPVLGRIEIYDIGPLSSRAHLLEGEARRGLVLEEVP